jgi:hypothetical protein
MSDFEHLTLLFSVGSLAVALLALIVSWRTAIAQARSAQNAHILALRSTAASEHHKYVEVLNDERGKLRVLRAAIAEAARTALSSIGNAADELADGRPRRTDHLLLEAAELLYDAFLPELSFQSSAHLRWRISGLRHRHESLHEQLEPLSMAGSVSDYVRRRLRLSRSASFPEVAVVETRQFQLLNLELRARLAGPVSRKLLARIADETQPLREAHSQHQLALKHVEVALETARVYNDQEEFSLGELSPRLDQALARELSKVGILQHLTLDDLHDDIVAKVREPVPWIVSSVLLVCMLARCEAWDA